MSRTRNLRCPRCARPSVGDLPLALLLAMDLQAERHGVGFECRNCGHEFLHKVEPAGADAEAATGYDAPSLADA